MRQIRSQQTRAVITLSLAFVAHAGATATYDYGGGKYLVIDVRTSPDKMFSIVSGENKAGEFGVYLRDVQIKKLIGQLEEGGYQYSFRRPTHSTPRGRRIANMLELRRGLTGTGRTTPFIALKIDAHIR